MNILEFINKYIVVINSIVLLILVFRYIQDLRRYRLEHEKLKYELEKLKNETQNNQRLVVEASQEQIEEYIIIPASNEIKRAAEQLRESVESFHRAQLDSYQQMAQPTREARSELREIASYLSRILTLMEEVNLRLSKQPEVKIRVSVDEDRKAGT